MGGESDWDGHLCSGEGVCEGEESIVYSSQDHGLIGLHI